METESTTTLPERSGQMSCSPSCEVHRRLDDALKEIEWERNVRKNLQHVIVSGWGAESIGKCIDAIRDVERSIGPLGPISEWSLAQILSAHLQQPAELIINDLLKQIEELKANNTALAQPERNQTPTP